MQIMMLLYLPCLWLALKQHPQHSMGPSCCFWRTLRSKGKFCFAFTVCWSILQWLWKWCSPSQALKCGRAPKIWMLPTSIQALNAAIQDQSIWEVVLYPRGCRPPVLGYSNQHSAGAGAHRWYPCAFPLPAGKVSTEFLAVPLRWHFPMQWPMRCGDSALSCHEFPVHPSWHPHLGLLSRWRGCSTPVIHRAKHQEWEASSTGLLVGKSQFPNPSSQTLSPVQCQCDFRVRHTSLFL